MRAKHWVSLAVICGIISAFSLSLQDYRLVVFDPRYLTEFVPWFVYGSAIFTSVLIGSVICARIFQFSLDRKWGMAIRLGSIPIVTMVGAAITALMYALWVSVAFTLPDSYGWRFAFLDPGALRQHLIVGVTISIMSIVWHEIKVSHAPWTYDLDARPPLTIR